MDVLAGVGIAALAVVLGVGAAALVKRRARPQSSWTRTSGLVAVAAATALVVGAIGMAVLFGGRAGNPFAPTPAFASLQAHPDASIQGTVAYNALASPNATKTGKESCVMVVAAGGATPRKLLCVPVTKAMGPALRWAAPGHLEVTARSGALWRRDVDLATGAVMTLPYQKPGALSSTGPHGEKVTWTNELGRFRAFLTVGSTKTTLLSVDAPRTYGWENATWSASGAWFAVADFGARILIVTTANPQVRVLARDGELPVASAYVLGS
jgi:hypothetical protein